MDLGRWGGREELGGDGEWELIRICCMKKHPFPIKIIPTSENNFTSYTVFKMLLKHNINEKNGNVKLKMGLRVVELPLPTTCFRQG